MRTWLLGVGVGVSLLGASARPVAAQFTTFASRAAFEAAAGALVTETFARPFELVPLAGATYGIAGGTLTVDANHGGMTIGGGDAFLELHPAGAGEPQFVRFDFAAPITAFGADFSLFDDPTFTLRALVGGATFDFGEGFFGVVSTTPFTTLELRDASGETYFVLDDLAVTATPEPATVWLTLGGLLTLAAAARRGRSRYRVTGHAARGATAAVAARALGACADDVAAPDGGRPSLQRAATSAAAAAVSCTPGNGDITLPPGFCAVVVADNVGTARHLTVDGDGDVYVAIDQASNQNGILALRDSDGDGDADQSQYFGAPRANGIAIFRHFLYVAYRSQVVRYRLLPGELVPSAGPEVVVSGLPNSPILGANDHPRKNITFDGRSAMFVNHGSATNSCQVQNRVAQSPGVDPCPELPTRAAIWRFNALAVGQTMANGTPYAIGFRNTEALRYDPGRRALFGLPHGRDELHENWPQFFTEQEQADLPSEEFIRIDQGDDAGWPYCMHDWQQNKKVLAPEYGGDGFIVGPRCATKEVPLLAFPGHWAPNDLLFYYGAQFPARYRGGAFIAFHGGHDRAPLPNEGYNVVFVPFAGNAPAGGWEVFADGFTGGGTPLPQNAAHRPMGLADGPDGSLFVSDDRGGRIWRIVYRGATP